MPSGTFRPEAPLFPRLTPDLLGLAAGRGGLVSLGAQPQGVLLCPLRGRSTGGAPRRTTSCWAQGSVLTLGCFYAAVRMVLNGVSSASAVRSSPASVVTPLCSLPGPVGRCGPNEPAEVPAPGSPNSVLAELDAQIQTVGSWGCWGMVSGGGARQYLTFQIKKPEESTPYPDSQHNPCPP